MFTHKELNLCKMRWLEFLKDYDISVYYNSAKGKLVVGALSILFMGSVAYVENEKKDLVKDAHRLILLGFAL